MAASKISDQVRGKTIRLSWTEGPTKGTTHEHLFHEDGTVEWHAVGGKQAAKKVEHPPYAGMKVSDEVCMISYLAKSGYTLSVVLNFVDRSTVGVASNQKDWTPVRGRFEVVE